MTTLEKITTLNWFDFLRKIKDILLNLNTSTNQKLEEAPIDGLQYARQDATWSEVVGGAGGSQDLQSILTEGNIALNSSIKLTDTEFTAEYTQDAIITSYLDTQVFRLNYNYADSNNLVFSIPQSPNTNNTFPVSVNNNFADPQGNIEITLGSQNLDSRIYANNAAAISGGLVAKDLYRTSTGELRIVV